jgi:hypothetical protein
MAEQISNDRITLGELLLSASKMSDALRVDTKKTVVISCSIANNATAPEKVIATEQYTEILFRALVSRVAKTRWRFEAFRGPGGRPPAGIVDAIAMRKDHRKAKGGSRGDRFQFILVQMKGGNAPRPTDKDKERLRRAKAYYAAKEVVLFEWRPNKGAQFSVLNGSEWKESTAEKIFG